MARMIAASLTMPILTASGRMSPKMQSICWATNSGEAFSMPYTPVVFCAVRAVMALIAYMRWAVMVLMSAWMPAPPEESEPAMVSTVFMVWGCSLVNR